MKKTHPNERKAADTNSEKRYCSKKKPPIRLPMTMDPFMIQ